MKKVAWLTDIHLDHIDDAGIESFCEMILSHSPDCILIGGDLSTAPRLLSDLQLLDSYFPVPTFFVLGNHDYYFGSIAHVRRELLERTAYFSNLRWLPQQGVVPLCEDTCLIGHGSWADGRFGNYEKSKVLLNDYIHIQEFVGLNSADRLSLLNTLGDEAAEFFRSNLPLTIDRYRKVIVLTHVPPFQEACWYEGRISDENFLPHFSCKAVGIALQEFMLKYPQKEMLVLCGHTHGEGIVEMQNNLIVKTGGAVYGKPGLQEFLDL